MIRRLRFLLALGLLVGCASQSSLMNVRDMTDETLVENYRQIVAEMHATRSDLEATSKSGRPISSAIHQDTLNSLKKRRATVELEMMRRGIPIPALEVEQ